MKKKEKISIAVNQNNLNLQRKTGCHSFFKKQCNFSKLIPTHFPLQSGYDLKKWGQSKGRKTLGKALKAELGKHWDRQPGEAVKSLLLVLDVRLV